MTPTPSYDGSLIFEEEDDITALPALPGCGMEPARPSLNLASGAAARAAAAAQNEILDSMQKITLAETDVTRDSESGVGIEVQDSGETIAEFDFDIPVVRQGITTRGHHDLYFTNNAQILYLFFPKNLLDIYFLIWMLALC